MLGGRWWEIYHVRTREEDTSGIPTGWTRWEEALEGRAEKSYSLAVGSVVFNGELSST